MERIYKNHLIREARPLFKGQASKYEIINLSDPEDFKLFANSFTEAIRTIDEKTPSVKNSHNTPSDKNLAK